VEGSTAWSPDGQWIYFHQAKEPSGIFKIRVEGSEANGEPVYVAGRGMSAKDPLEASDGKEEFVFFWTPGPDGPWTWQENRRRRDIRHGRGENGCSFRRLQSGSTVSR